MCAPGRDMSGRMINVMLKTKLDIFCVNPLCQNLVILFAHIMTMSFQSMRRSVKLSLNVKNF